MTGTPSFVNWTSHSTRSAPLSPAATKESIVFSRYSCLWSPYEFPGNIDDRGLTMDESQIDQWMLSCASTHPSLYDRYPLSGCRWRSGDILIWPSLTLLFAVVEWPGTGMTPPQLDASTDRKWAPSPCYSPTRSCWKECDMSLIRGDKCQWSRDWIVDALCTRTHIRRMHTYMRVSAHTLTLKNTFVMKRSGLNTSVVRRIFLSFGMIQGIKVNGEI